MNQRHQVAQAQTLQTAAIGTDRLHIVNGDRLTLPASATESALKSVTMARKALSSAPSLAGTDPAPLCVGR